MTEENYQNTYFSLVQKVGSKGRYQIYLTFVTTLQAFIIGSILLAPGLLFLQSPPDCSSVHLEEGQLCMDYICKYVEQQDWKHFYPTTIDSLRYSFGQIYICNKAWIVSVMQSLVYLGAFISDLTLSYSIDNYGRKTTTMLAAALMLLGVVLIGTSQNMYMVGSGLLLTGIGIDPCQNALFFMMSQMIDGTAFMYHNLFTQIGFTAGGTLIGGVAYWMPHWRKMIIFAYIIPEFFVCLLIFMLQETPRYNFKKGIQIGIKSLQRIKKINKIENEIDKQDVINVLEKTKKIENEMKSKTINLLDIFRFRSLRTPTLCLGLVWGCLMVMYYGPVLIIQQLKTNDYLNQTLFSLSDALAYIFVFLCISKIPRKISGFICLGIFGVLNTIAIFISNSILILSIICVARTIMCFWFCIFILYNNELIPSVARGLSYGISGIIERFFTISNPTLISSWSTAHLNPIILFTGFSIIAMLALLPLKQTLNMKLSQQIEELQQKLMNSLLEGEDVISTSVIINKQ